jgi:UTP:GlnB (protein PII) uridylyltransferase
VLALLFHDVGKWRDDDHAEESVRMALEMMRRLQLPEESVAVVEFLIRHHTKMSLIAFRRDTEDPEIVRQLADLVGIEERLKMLCLLTLVDVEAVNPETLTPWREDLLWRLYVDTYNHLTLEYADERIERRSPDCARSSPAARTTSRKLRLRGSPRVCPAGISSSSARGHLPPRALVTRYPSGRRPRRFWSARDRCGS